MQANRLQTKNVERIRTKKKQKRNRNPIRICVVICLSTDEKGGFRTNSEL